MVFVLLTKDTEKTIELQKRIIIFYLQQIPLTSKDNHFHKWKEKLEEKDYHTNTTRNIAGMSMSF